MLKIIKQIHDNGCFLACLAILKGITYEQAFQLVYPGRTMPPKDAIYREHDVALPTEQALKLMPRFGLHLQKSNLRSVHSLRRRTSLILLRWQVEPTQMHALVYDGEAGKILDPCYDFFPVTLGDINNNLDSIYYVKKSRQLERHHQGGSASGRSNRSLPLAI
jgi:hypothetical protein